MTEEQFSGHWHARLIQVGSVYEIEVDMPFPVDGKPVTVVVRGIGDHTDVTVKPRPRRAFLPNEGNNQR